MVKLILFLGFCALSAHAATYEGAKLHRLVRSPHYGAHFHYDHPPFGPPPLFPAPPPLIYRTHNWSGVGRGIDGAVKGVFSGAAAAAESAVPALNSAFSIAEAGSNTGGFGADSAECDDNSDSSGSKITGQYNSKSSQFGSQQFGSSSGGHVGQLDSNSGGGFGGSEYNSHSSFKESTSSSSQSGQNSALNGHEYRGFGDQISDVNAEHGGHSRGYGDYTRSFKESHYSVQNGGGDKFRTQENGEFSQGGFRGSQQSTSGGFYRPQTQGPSSDYGHFSASSQGSAQSGSSTLGSGSGNYNSGSHGFDSSKHQAGGSANFESQQSKDTAGAQQSYGHGSGFPAGQNGNKAEGFGQTSGSSAYGFGNSNYNSGAHDFDTSKLQAGGSAKFETQQLKDTAGAEQSFGHGAGFSTGQTGNNAEGFGQSSESSAFGSGNSNYNSGAHGGRAKFESQQLKDTAGAEQSFGHGAGFSTGQTGNNAESFSQSSGSSGFGSGTSNYNPGAHGFDSSKLQAGGSATFKSQQLKAGSEQSFEHGASLASGQTSNNAAGFGHLSAFGSGSSNYNSGAHGFDNSKFPAGGSANLGTQQLKTTGRAEQSYGLGAETDQAGNGAAGYGQHGSALNGALELVKQGLQAADNAKCSTCQKSSYALSNAKSHNGAAIALSIGG